MKKTVFAIVCAACAAWAAEMPRSEWHAKVGDCAQDPALLRQTISQLSPADQTAFLAEVNEAISKMPGSEEVKAAKFLDANRAAILGATPENRTAVLAEVFATVPPEFLTVVNESFAMDLFNRSNANTSRAISDADYVALASKAMDAIVERCATADHPEVRSTFAALMFERASGGPTEGLRDALISKLPPAAQESARSDWMPTALGEGREKSYDPMLGVAEAGEAWVEDKIAHGAFDGNSSRDGAEGRCAVRQLWSLVCRKRLFRGGCCDRYGRIGHRREPCGSGGGLQREPGRSGACQGCRRKRKG